MRDTDKTRKTKKAYKEKNAKNLHFEFYQKDWDLYDKFMSLLAKTKNDKLRKLFKLAERKSVSINSNRKENSLTFNYMHGELGNMKGGLVVCKNLDLDDIKQALGYLTQDKKTWGSNSDYDECRQGKNQKIYQDPYGTIHIEKGDIEILLSVDEAKKILNGNMTLGL
ncbi:hypothetical protein [Francisella hispaniensis]|uniref:Uncharacterized protein n=1 Tax=Francisella hispaniensis TaxID=622488 RepID=F4BK80_9GAMM|nr:hypothetical protein [Francisella hispaniensis]AEB28574.1 hypothetical protein FN3523_0717 [Francisella hispaniensis]